MDEQLLCPDCRELHTEPAEATLGHLVRCWACVLAAEVVLAAESAERSAPLAAVPLAMRPAA